MTYKGYDVLLEEPNRIVAETVRASLSADVLDNLTGKGVIDPVAPTPLITRTFSWFLDSTDAILSFKAWLDDRKGRLNAFWAPSWQRDLHPINILSSSATLDVRPVAYPQRMFPHQARRYLAFVEPDFSMTIREVTGAVSLGHLERLTLDSPVTTTSKTMISYLIFYRLASDDAIVEYRAQFAAEVELTFVEVPREVP